MTVRTQLLLKLTICGLAGLTAALVLAYLASLLVPAAHTWLVFTISAAMLSIPVGYGVTVLWMFHRSRR